MKPTADIIAGINPVVAALKANPQGITCLHVAAGAQNRRVKDIEMMAADLGVKVTTSPRHALDELAGMDRHQDVVAEVHKATVQGEGDLDELLDALETDPFLLVLDGVQDPHNLGACLRTAEGAGVHAVIIPRDRAVGLTPVVRKTAAGAAESLPLVQVANLARCLRGLKARGIWLCGTSDAADVTVYQQDLKGPLALVMGSEGQGMRRLTAELCDFLVSIPMAGSVESLNVSVATGVTLYEAVRQRAG